MMYLTLEKAPQLAGMGPWMGVVVGEKQVDSDYPEEKKVRKICIAALVPGESWYLWESRGSP